MKAFVLFLPIALAWGQISFVDERLPNGAQVIACLHQNVSHTVVSLVVKGGSASDPSGREGTAHFLEHLLPLQPFDGTTVQIAMERKGALLMPETGRDFMAFHLQMLPNEFERVSALLVQLANDLKVDLQVAEQEKQLMWLETLALYEDPLWLAKSMVEAELFAGTNYVHPPTGWLETIEQLSLEDAVRFHHSNFVAQKMAIIAAVRIELDLAILREVASKLPNGLPQFPETVSVSTANYSPRLETLLRQKLVSSREVFWGIGWRFKLGAEEKTAFDGLVTYLRQSFLPALFGQLGVINEWNLVANFVKGEVALSLVAHLKTRTELVEIRLRRALEQLAEKGLPKSDLERVKRVLELEHRRNLLNPMRLVRELSYAWAVHDAPEIFECYDEAIANLGVEDVKKIATRLASQRPVVVTVGK